MAEGGQPNQPAFRSLAIRQLSANRRNALKGGVKTSEGKSISRLNARKHGIFATALTPMDCDELKNVYERFAAELEPATQVEDVLVEKLAVTYLRLQRCARAEAEYQRAAWMPKHDEFSGGPLGGLSDFKSMPFWIIADRVHRYDKSLTNQFLKVLHALERLQRIRAGQQVPPPLAADVNLSAAE